MSVNTIVRRSRRLIDDAADRTAGTATAVRAAFDDQRDAARSGLRAASTHVRRHPLRAVGAATAAGVLVGILVMLFFDRRQ